jgi:hypothetical protein
MEGHVKILAILYIVFGALGVLLALLILTIFGGVAGIVGSVTQDQPDARIALPIIGAVGGFIAILLLILSAPNVVAGVGMLKYQEWARILTIVLSILNLPFIPFGTILGVYGLWVLFNQQTIALFSRVRPPGAQT